MPTSVKRKITKRNTNLPRNNLRKSLYLMVERVASPDADIISDKSLVWIVMPTSVSPW